MILRPNIMITVCLLSFGPLFAGCGDDDGGSAVCGNGICEQGETVDNCPDDCGCGNGVITDSEECDGDDLGGNMCTDLGYEGGSLGCNDDCTFDTGGCYNEEECGNGVIAQGEDCDAGELGGATCESERFDGGTLACNDSTCRFDLTGCCLNGCSVLYETRCSGDVIQTCAAMDNGCMDWVDTKDCSDDGLECVVSEGAALCDIDCVNECDQEGVRQCDGDVIQNCVMNLNGCLELVNEQDCSDNNETCVEDGDTAYCEGTCENECTEGEEQCDGDVIQTCEQNLNGCWVWVNGDDCSDNGQVCAVSEGTASCADTCINECDTADALQCNGDILEICQMGGDGCLHWVTSVNCGDNGQMCDDSGADPVCVDAPIGEVCEYPAEVTVGVNEITGTFTDHPSPGFSCSAEPPNTVWLSFTAPEEGDYEISITNSGSGWVGMVVLDGTGCFPYDAELLCQDHGESLTITQIVPLNNAQTVLLASFTDDTDWDMVDPVVTIKRLCDPDTEFACNNGECIPSVQVCDDTENCADGSDEWGCYGGEQCHNPIVVQMGHQSFFGTFDDDPVGEFSCHSSTYNAVWFEFTAPEDGEYILSAENNTSTFAFSRLVVLDGTDCSPYGEELLCITETSKTISGEVSLTSGQTVLIVFTADGDTYTMVHPELTISVACDPDTEFTCDNGECIPLEEVCDGTEDCTDGSDEQGCGPGEICQNPEILEMGLNTFSGTFDDDPVDHFSCSSSTYNAFWAEFTAPADGHYGIFAENYTSTAAYSRLVILGGTDCSPYGEELHCSTASGKTISGEVTLAAGETVLIVFTADGESWTMVDPEITVTELCHPATEFTCDNEECVPLAGLCDGTENCTDGSDETFCSQAERCQNPEVAYEGVNSYTGTFDHDPDIDVSCTVSKYNAFWFSFTAPAAGAYRIFAENKTTTSASSRLVFFDGAGCGPLGDELFCGTTTVKTIEGELIMTEGQTVLVAFMTSSDSYTMMDPEVTVTELCNPDTEFTCDNEECVDLNVLCDGTDDCIDGSDETYCEPGEMCQTAEEVNVGVNSFTGEFEVDHPNEFSCDDNFYNTFWAEFTAPADGVYEISGDNKTSDDSWSRMAVLDDTNCNPYGAELACDIESSTSITVEATLTAGQTVLIVFASDGDLYGMENPDITINQL